MTFTIRERGVGGDVELEFLCDSHGRFEARIPRRDPGDTAPCPECGASSLWSPSSAPAVKLQLVTAGSMGKTEPRPHAGVMDTRPMAEGQRYGAWKRDRAKYWQDVDRAHARRIKETR